MSIISTSVQFSQPSIDATLLTLRQVVGFICSKLRRSPDPAEAQTLLSYWTWYFDKKLLMSNFNYITMGDWSLIVPVPVHKIIPTPPGMSWVSTRGRPKAKLLAEAVAEAIKSSAFGRRMKPKLKVPIMIECVGINHKI